MQGDAENDRPAHVFMDLTTSRRARGAQANGTLRVERSYAAALAPIFGSRLHFCRYDAGRRRFVALSAAAAAEQTRAADGAAPTALGGTPRRASLARDIERTVRHWRRAAMVRLWRSIEATQPLLADAKRGDILLMVGENWSNYDFDVIAALRRRQQVRVVTLCQDLIPEVCPQFFEDGEFVARHQAYADFLIRDVDLVIAISQATKADILAYANRHGGMTGRLATVQLGALFAVETGGSPPRALTGLAPGSFVISVSTIQSRKNFDLLYHLWRRLSAEGTKDLPKLVIVGRRGFGSSDLLWQIQHDPVVRDSVAVVHDASDAELAWLYRNCLFTLYPSFYEGWGLPVSESLAYGKHCLASNTSSLPEAGQGLAQHLDPLDLPAWRAAVLELIHTPGLLAQREADIAARFRAVSWAESAERLAAEIDALADAGAMSPQT